MTSRCPSCSVAVSDFAGALVGGQRTGDGGRVLRSRWLPLVLLIRRRTGQEPRSLQDTSGSAQQIPEVRIGAK